MTGTERAAALADEIEAYADIIYDGDPLVRGEKIGLLIRALRLLAASDDPPAPDLMDAVADAIDDVDLVSRFNDWTNDRVEGFPIEIIDVSGVEVSGEGRVVSRHRAEEGGLVDALAAAERSARASAAFDAIDRAGFAVVTKAFVREVEAVVATFEESEKAGYRSKDRQFAINVLRTALTSASGREPTR